MASELQITRNPWWEEQDLTDVDRAYNRGYDEGFQAGCEATEEYNQKAEWYEKRIGQLEALLGANVRVMKAEIIKELKASGQIPDEGKRESFTKNIRNNGEPVQ